MNPKHKTEIQFAMTLSVLTCQSAMLKYVNSVSVYFNSIKIFTYLFFVAISQTAVNKKVTEVYLFWILY